MAAAEGRGDDSGASSADQASALAMFAMAQDGIRAVDQPFRDESKRLNAELRERRGAVLEYMLHNGLDEVQDDESGAVLAVTRGQSFACAGGADVANAGKTAMEETKPEGSGRGGETADVSDGAFLAFLRRRVNAQRKKEGLPPLGRVKRRPTEGSKDRRSKGRAATRPKKARRPKATDPARDAQREAKRKRIEEAATRLAAAYENNDTG